MITFRRWGEDTYVLDEERVQDDIGESTVLQWWQQRRLLEHVHRHNIGAWNVQDHSWIKTYHSNQLVRDARRGEGARNGCFISSKAELWQKFFAGIWRATSSIRIALRHRDEGDLHEAWGGRLRSVHARLPTWLSLKPQTRCNAMMRLEMRGKPVDRLSRRHYFSALIARQLRHLHHQRAIIASSVWHLVIFLTKNSRFELHTARQYM